MHLKQQRQLIQAEVVSEAQLAAAEQLACSSNKSLLHALLEIHGVNVEAVLSLLEKIYKTPYVDITSIKPDEGLLELCPEKICLGYGILPISDYGSDLEIATSDPLDVDMLNALGFKLGRRIIARFSRPDLILKKITELYLDGATAFDAAMDELEDVHELTHERDHSHGYLGGSLDELKRGAEESPVIKLVDGVIVQAMKLGSSDIHIEPGEKCSVVRMRVDGRLRPVLRFPIHAHALVVSRIKIMSRLDIANNRTPQDGRTRVKMWGRYFDMRISTLPAMYGEKVVLRILDKGGVALNLDVLCFEETAYRRIRSSIGESSGAVLVTGPTGSGKTTTLYSLLNHIRDDEMNLITIEDPIEFQVEGVNQVQVNPKAGMSFATVLRSILRQDPDVVMIGEIRDTETAEIALHAAQTGHLVLSTLHTNDAPATVMRLIDMGVEAQMLASSLKLIVAQRLVRRLCVHCRKQVQPDAEVMQRFGIPEEIAFFDRVGCKACMHIGYKGRMAIHEVLCVNERIRALISRGSTDHELMRVAREEGMLTLFEDGLSKAMAGQTSLEEVLRVCKAPEGYMLRDYLDKHMQMLSYSEVQHQRRIHHNIRETVGGHKRILVADASATVRRFIEFVLEADGHKVIQASSDKEVLEQLMHMQPDMLIHDCDAPDMGGIGLIRRIRHLERFRNMSVILLSSSHGEDGEVLGLGAGADDYIIKPLEPLKLQARVRKLLSLYDNLEVRGQHGR